MSTLNSRPTAFRDDMQSTQYNKNISKTPGRTLKGRAILQENILSHGPKTTIPKEKNRAHFATPFKQKDAKIQLRDAPTTTKHASLLPHRPLVDKTPLPNRQNIIPSLTPLSRSGKISKLPLSAFIDDTDPNAPLQPPSSGRKKLRIPRNSGKNFETPVTEGDHWNVSDISIDASSSNIVTANEASENEPDYSDPEYMPPTANDCPYEPPFELPNYREVGRKLLELSRSYSFGQSTHALEIGTENILDLCDWGSHLFDLELPDTEEENIFGPPINRPEAADSILSALAVSRKQVGQRGNDDTTTTKTTRSLRSRPMQTKPHVARQPPRPATSASVPIARNSRPMPTSTTGRPRTSTAVRKEGPSRNSTAKPLTTRARATVKKDSIHLLHFNDTKKIQEDDFQFNV